MRSVRGALVLLALIACSAFATAPARALDLRAPVRVEIAIGNSGAASGAGAGRPVTVSVRVVPATGSTVVPTGALTLRHDGDPIASGSLRQGRVDFRAGLVAGTHTYTADYDGDNNFVPAPASSTASPGVSYTVGRERLVLEIGASTDPAGTVTFTLTLQFQPSVPPADASDGWADLPTSLPPAASGTITFSDNGTAVGTVPVAPPSTTFTTSLAPGSHAVEGHYSGDANFDALTTEPLFERIEATATTTSTTVPPTRPPVANVPPTAPAPPDAQRPNILAGLLSSGRPTVAPSQVAPAAPIAIPGDVNPATSPAANITVPTARRADTHAAAVVAALAACLLLVNFAGAGWFWRRRATGPGCA